MSSGPKGPQWTRRRQDERYPPIGDYALIGDCHSAALVSRAGSIDWCCMPRLSSDSVFGRLLDWDEGGHFSIQPTARSFSSHRYYLPDTMVLVTHFTSAGGEARMIDLFAMRRGGRDDPRRQLIRKIEGIRGHIEFGAEIRPRFDYGEVRPWIRRAGRNLYAAIGGDSGLLISCDAQLEPRDHELHCRFDIRANESVRFSVVYSQPELLDSDLPDPPEYTELDQRIEETTAWWRRWSRHSSFHGPDAVAAGRSALVLKCLSHAPTGALAAAATTSLPESIGGARNWDYRFSWIRDSTYSVRALSEIGFDREADGFRRFIQRSAAGSAEELQIMYGLRGERRLNETLLDNLDGYRGSRPVRVGNGAAKQLQLDAFGDLVQLSWRWHRRGASPDDDYWKFLVEIVETAAERWQEPDCGIWEIRGKPRHFVHSKVMCWVALDRGVALAEECLRRAPLARWRKTARQIKDAIDQKGCDPRLGSFVQSFGAKQVDAALLLLPTTGFVAWDDERMVRTADRIRDELLQDGLVLRYRPDSRLDGQQGEEGTFLACTFWLAECFARQGRLDEARQLFDRGTASGTDLGLFAEEFDPKQGLMVGNVPQALSHLAHLTAIVALRDAEALGRHS